MRVQLVADVEADFLSLGISTGPQDVARGVQLVLKNGEFFPGGTIALALTPAEAEHVMKLVNEQISLLCKQRVSVESLQ